MIQLNKREIFLLKILGSIVAVLVLIFFVIQPLLSLRNSINTQYENNTERLTRLRMLYSKYSKIRTRRNHYQRLMQNDKGITTIIEENAKSLNINDNKSYIRIIPGTVKDNYKKQTAHVKFVGLPITSILHFIHKMENSNSLIRVSYVRINQALRGKDVYDVTLKLDTVTSQ